MTTSKLPAVLVVLAACGQPDANDAIPPVTLRWMEAPPCLSPLEVGRAAPPGPATEQASQQLQLQEMALSFQEPYARLLVEPVVSDPTALEWRRDHDRWWVEGRSLARAEDWGTLVVAATFMPPDLPARVLRADVRYSLEKTEFEFDDGVLEFGANYRKWDGFVRGCDAATSINFVVGPWPVDGVVVDRVLLCWQTGGPVVEKSALTCQAAFDRVVQREFVQPVLRPPVMFLY